VDLRLDLLHTDQESAQDFERVVDRLAAEERIATFAPMVTTRHDTVDRDGRAISLYIENGDHGLLPLRYAEGRPPVDEAEVEGVFGGFEYLGQGTSRIAFSVNPLLAYVALPGALLLAVAAATSAISTRSIPDATIATLNTE